MQAATRILRTGAVAGPRIGQPAAALVHAKGFHASRNAAATAAGTSSTSPSANAGVSDTGKIINGVDGGGVGTKGRTGGGDALGSTAPGAPNQPKVSNFSTPGVEKYDDLSKEQKKEVDEHNRAFYETHERDASTVAKNEVDEKFWKGTKGGGGKSKKG